MRVPLSWLHEYAHPDIDTHALAEPALVSAVRMMRRI